MLIFRAWATCEIRRQPRYAYAVRFNEKSNKQHENRSIYTKLTNICTTSSPADSLRASSPIWASETSLVRTRVLARLASLPRWSTDAMEFLKCPGPKRTGSACAWRLPVWIGLDYKNNNFESASFSFEDFLTVTARLRPVKFLIFTFYGERKHKQRIFFFRFWT